MVIFRKPLNKSPKKKCDLKAPTGKIKSGSRTKPITTSPRKRKPEPKTRKRKRKDTNNIEKTKEGKIDASVDLNVDDFQKGKAFDGSLENDIRIDERDLKIESLPSKIQTEDNRRSIEIEIIDNVPANDVNEKNNTNIDETRDTNSLTPSKRKSNLIMKKRGDKRPKVKSRFKKMGMLPVANFKEQT